MSNVNYQKLFEDNISTAVKDGMDLPHHFFDLSDAQKRMVEELIHCGYVAAVEEVLDPDVLGETMTLSAELGAQLYNFANMLQFQYGNQEPEGNDEL